MHNLCRITWTTHCNLLPNRADVMDPELLFSKSRVIIVTLNSDNVSDKTIINVVLNDTHSIMDGNLRPQFIMEECNVLKCWDEKCTKERNVLLDNDIEECQTTTVCYVHIKIN